MHQLVEVGSRPRTVLGYVAKRLQQGAADNETVEIAETFGTVATDLHGAFAEMAATAAGTNATNYLYSLSINPSAPLTREQIVEAIEQIADRLGLAGQPRAVIFHVKADKNGLLREHCHVVWSKIDAVNMKAIHIAYDHAALCDLSCELARKFGLDLPPGLKAWEQKRPFEKPYLEATLAENAIARETGVTPAQREAEITATYNRSDTPRTFQVALAEAGYLLAQGDKRRYVVVDRFCKVHSLTRYIKGHTAKTINTRLQAALAFADLPSTGKTKDYIRQHQQAIEDRPTPKVERVRDRAIEALLTRQKTRRAPLTAKEQDLLVRHAAERISLHAAQSAEYGQAHLAGAPFIRRVKNAVARLIKRTPGLRSVLGPVTGDKALNIATRHALEVDALAGRHAAEQAMMARQCRSMAAVDARERQALEQALRRKITETDIHSPSLMTHPLHENEQLHRLHEHLVKHRRRAFKATFNACANPRNKREDDERESIIRHNWDCAIGPRPKRPY